MKTVETFDATRPDAPAMAAALARDGVCVARNFVPSGALARVRDEAMALAATREPWLVHHASASGFFVSFSPLVARKERVDARIVNLVSAFGQPLARTVCRHYLGAGWFVERVILDRKETGPEPITGWHADQFERQGKCVKFMLYLADTGPDNGAFSYVRGSHHLIDALVAAAGREHLDNRALHTWEDIGRIATRALAAGGWHAGAGAAALQEASGHIRSSDESDDYYSIAAPAGSAVVFDANGIHRGGVVHAGERFVVRSHCRALQPAVVLGSRGAFRTFLERLRHRWTAPAPLRGLV